MSLEHSETNIPIQIQVVGLIYAHATQNKQVYDFSGYTCTKKFSLLVLRKYFDGVHGQQNKKRTKRGVLKNTY